MWSQSRFFGFHSAVWGFLGEKIKNTIRYSISPRKSYIRFCRPASLSLKNCNAPKKFFSLLFWKILFFFRKNCNEKYSEPQCLQKKVILIFVVRCPFSLKTVMSFHIWFFAVFSENTAVFEKLI